MLVNAQWGTGVIAICRQKQACFQKWVHQPDSAAMNLQVTYLVCVRQEYEQWIACSAALHYQSAPAAALHN